MKPGELLTLFREAYLAFGQDKAPRLAAAIAYYAIFSLAPMLFIALAFASRFLASVDVQEQLAAFLAQNLDPDAVKFVQGLIPSESSLQRSSLIATVIGLGTLFLGATGLFVQLQDALNSMWGADPGPPVGPLALIRTRLVSFLLIIAFGGLIIAFLVGNTYLSVVSQRLGDLIGAGAFFVRAGSLLLSALLLTPLFAAVYKFLPTVKLEWREVWVGSAVTSVMFTLGQLGIGLYLGRAAPGSAFGAAATLIVILLWIYLSAMIFFFGAELTWVYSQKFGTHAGGAANVAKKRALVAQGAQISTEPSDQELGALGQGGPVRDARGRVLGISVPRLPRVLPQVARHGEGRLLPSVRGTVWNAVLAVMAIPAVVVLRVLGLAGGGRKRP